MLKEIIKELKQVINDSELRITDSELLDCAVRIYNSRSINKYKQEITETKKSIGNKPTDAQVRLLKKLKIENIENLSKQEAIKLIDEKLNKKNISNPDY